MFLKVVVLTSPSKCEVLHGQAAELCSAFFEVRLHQQCPHLIPISFPSHSHLKAKVELQEIEPPGHIASTPWRPEVPGQGDFFGDMSRHESQAWHPKNPIKYLTNGCVCPPNIVLRCIKRFWPIPIPETTKIHQPHQPLSCLLLVWHALGSWLHRTVGQ